jgi:lipopolysaccharide export LptBFGC system permease protein LptF
MTANHPLRRLLARVCSAATMARVVDPTLADMRWESTRAAWLGYVSLAKALLVHGVISMPGMARRTWSDDEGAIPRVTLVTLAAALLSAAALMAAPLWASHNIGRFRGVLFVLTLLPQALVLTLPAALLLAVPLGLRHRRRSPRLARRTMALSIVVSLATLALVVWAVPAANQAFRVLVSGNPGLQPGPYEKGFAALREQIDTLNLTPGGRVVARQLEFGYQAQLALAFAPLPLGLLALGISGSPGGSRRPWLIGGAALLVYAIGMFALTIVIGLLLRASPIPPLFIAWVPNALTAAIAALLLSRYRSGFFTANAATSTNT